ncbi:MAG TPA: PDZ domain-containing protein [Thermoanaerobaculia bacterium]|nr:PDZ domain-containing protein [Thermoanaerobaculia bacterium]
MRALALLLTIGWLLAGTFAKGQEDRGDRARSSARAVVIGEDGRLVELRGEDGSALRLVPSGERDAPGAVVVLERLGLGRGFLGVQLIGLTEQLRVRFEAPPGEGALVSEVVAGSPAERAGVRAGDVITAVGSERVRRTGDVSRLVAGREGELVELEVLRAGAPIRLTAMIAERERPLVRVGRDGDSVVLHWIAGEGSSGLDAAGGHFFLDDALEGLDLYFVSDEWRDRAEGPGEDLDAAALERRIDSIKRQLDDLRRRLERIEPEG